MEISGFHKKQTRPGFENVSELRQDLVSGDWVLIATGRARRPHSFIKEKRLKLEQPISECPFENPQATGHGEPLLIYYEKKDWSLQVIKNKFPAFGPGNCSTTYKEGPYTLMDGAGFHEIIITRNHKKHIHLLPVEKIEEIIRAYQERYLALMKLQCANYISIFHNHGREAGASISHPHSQLMAFPIIPADIRRSLEGSEKFRKEHNRCVHCLMLKWEKDEGRSIFQNEHFIVYAPFVPRTAFELRIFPRKHKSNFERITKTERKYLAEALSITLGKLYRGLKDPPYNFFIHTAPCDGKDYKHYHWHIEVLPKTAIWAGFELGTGIEISTIEPEEVAKFLRKIK